MTAQEGKPGEITRSSCSHDLSSEACRVSIALHLLVLGESGRKKRATALWRRDGFRTCRRAGPGGPVESVGLPNTFGGYDTTHAHIGEHMRRISLYLVQASIFCCLGTLGLPAGLRAQSDADKVYKANCELCHAADGSANSPLGKALGAKNLRSGEVQKKTSTELVEFITQGKGNMPAFGKKFKTDEIKQLVAYVRALAKKK